VAGGGGGGAKL